MSAPILAIGFAFVAALLLNIWIATKWSTSFKVSLIVLATFFYVGSYIALKEIQGWPSTDPLPESFRLLWAKIEEPDKRINSKGRIYMWVQAVDVADRLSGAPRGYELPYEPELAEELGDAIEKLEGGVELNGRRSRGLLKEDPEMEIPSNPQEIADSDSDGKGFNDGRILIEFTELPKNTLPAKSI